jgi:hypothetical protein
MNAPSPTIATIARLGMPVALAENGEGIIVTERITKHSAMAAIAMANFNILIIYVSSYNAI